MADYDPGRDLTLGANYANTLVDTERKARAYNALNKIYGDIVGDPITALRAQEYGQNALINPLKVQEQQLTNQGQSLQNTGQQQTNDFNQQANPLKINALNLGNEGKQQDIQQAHDEFPLQQQQRQASIASTEASTVGTQASTAAAQDKLKTAQAQRAAQAGSALVDALMNAHQQGATPDQLAQLYDQNINGIAQLDNIDPQHVALIRHAIVTNPDQALPFLQQQLAATATSGSHVSKVVVDQNGNQFAVHSDGTMTPLGIGSGSFTQKTPTYQADVTKAKTVGKAQGAAAAQGIHGVEDTAKAQESLDNNEIRFDAADQNLKDALQLSNKAGSFAKLGGDVSSVTGFGTAGGNFETTLNSVHSDIVNNVIQGFKESTPKGQASGVGRVMQAQIKLWQDAYASVQSSQSPALRAKNIQRLMAVTDRLRTASRQYFGTVYGVKPGDGARAAQPAGGQQAAPPSGVVDYRSYFGSQ